MDDLDPLARGLAAEILDCHARRFDRAFARDRREDAGLIGQHAQLDDAARNFRLRRLQRFLLRRRRLNQRDGEEGESGEHADPPHAVGLLRTCPERPSRCRATKKRDEFPPPHVRTLGSGQAILAGQTSTLEEAGL